MHFVVTVKIYKQHITKWAPMEMDQSAARKTLFCWFLTNPPLVPFPGLCYKYPRALIRSYFCGFHGSISQTAQYFEAHFSSLQRYSERNNETNFMSKHHCWPACCGRLVCHGSSYVIGSLMTVLLEYCTLHSKVGLVPVPCPAVQKRLRSPHWLVSASVQINQHTFTTRCHSKRTARRTAITSSNFNRYSELFHHW